MLTTRDVWRIDRAGSLSRLRLTHEPLEPPRPGEAQVAVRAIGLNFADVFACLGLYSATPRGAFVPGLEFAGVVERVGPETSPGTPTTGSPPSRSLAPGDAVLGLTRFGAYATALNADLRVLRPVPAGWSFAEAAAWPVQGLTAWYGLVELGAVARGDCVLVHSAAGGVGLNALALLQRLGARIVGTVGSDEKRAFLVERRGLAAAQVIVRDGRRFGSQLDAALGAIDAAGFDVVFDAVAGPFFKPAHDRLLAEGRHVLYGAADFMPRGVRPAYLRLAWQYLRRPRLDPLRMIAANRSAMAFNLIWLWDRVERLAHAYDALASLLPEPAYVGHTFPFGDAPAALRWLQSGQSVGKVILQV